MLYLGLGMRGLPSLDFGVADRLLDESLEVVVGRNLLVKKIWINEMNSEIQKDSLEPKKDLLFGTTISCHL